MKSPYGSNFDGSTWPWTLDGDDGWFALHDAYGRYVSDACVEGDAEQMKALAHALRGRHNFSVKRCSARFNGTMIEFCSPRNTVGGHDEWPSRDAVEITADDRARIAPPPPLRRSTQVTDCKHGRDATGANQCAACQPSGSTQVTDIDAVCEAVVQAKNAEIEKLLTELVVARPIVAAAKALREARRWRLNYTLSEAGAGEFWATYFALEAAIDAARGKL